MRDESEYPLRRGKTRRDKAKGHRPWEKNTKTGAARGHLRGRGRHAWRKEQSRAAKGTKFKVSPREDEA